MTRTFVASAVAIAMRYHRSAGEERAQMKWFAAAGAIAAVGFAIGVVTMPRPRLRKRLGRVQQS